MLKFRTSAVLGCTPGGLAVLLHSDDVSESKEVDSVQTQSVKSEDCASDVDKWTKFSHSVTSQPERSIAMSDSNPTTSTSSEVTPDGIAGSNSVSEIDPFGEMQEANVWASLPNAWARLLIIESESGNVDDVQALLEDPDIDVNMSIDGVNALFVASQQGHPEVVRLLLERSDADWKQVVEQKESNAGGSRSALMIACELGHVDVVNEFLAFPYVDINRANESGWTPLMFACFYVQPKIVELLLGVPTAEVNNKNANGHTPLSLAVIQGHVSGVQQLLDDPRVDVNKCDKHGGTPLSNACDRNIPVIVQQLLKHPDIDLNPVLHTGATPLLMASALGFSKVVQVLLHHPNTNVNFVCRGNKDQVFPTVFNPIARYRNIYNRPVTVGRNEDGVLVAAPSNTRAYPITWDGEYYQFKISSGYTYRAKAAVDEFENGGFPKELIWVDESGRVGGWRHESVGPVPTAFLAACQNGHEEIVRLFLERKDVDVTKTDQQSSTRKTS